jgi:pSer/pThr/pTyr-binding forkhead associated (FHA) protein
MSLSKSSFFLVHAETGQRYPIRAGVIIGRGSADIVFSKDTKLSNQHCEVVPSEKGLAVRDLHSVNGSFIDGKKLQPDKGYLLKPGSDLTAGDQTFNLQTVSLTKNLRKRRNKKRGKSGESYWQVFLMLIAAVAFFAWHKGGFTIDRPNEVSMSQRQLGEIFENYQEMQQSLQRQSVPPQDVAKRMQGQILGRLSGVSRRWGEFQPTDAERTQFNALMKFAGALAGHAKNQVLYINSADSKYINELDTWTDQLEQAANEVRGLPTGMSFPILVQSPLQLVEREMRQSIRDYEKLGRAADRSEITQKEMAEKIRTALMPKMNAVYSKMGVISPQNEFERKKVVTEQKLMTAFIGQVKAISLLTESGDPKYGAEIHHWTEELMKANKELKEQLNLGRTPASKPVIVPGARGGF